VKDVASATIGTAPRTWVFAAPDERAEKKVRLMDPSAFWERLAPVQDKLYNYIHKSLSFSIEADDVFQETVLNAFRYFETFKADREFGPWVFAIAHNVLRDHFRRAARTLTTSEAERWGKEDPTRTRELVREVYRYAEGLKPRHREVFFLFYDSGFSVAEIAGITGLSQGNVKLILFQARRELKSALGVTHE